MIGMFIAGVAAGFTIACIWYDVGPFGQDAGDDR